MVWLGVLLGVAGAVCIGAMPFLSERRPKDRKSYPWATRNVWNEPRVFHANLAWVAGWALVALGVLCMIFRA